MKGKMLWFVLPTGAIKSDITGHGSRMLSKIAGLMFGTAKAVNVAIMKITKDIEMEADSVWLRALRLVLQDVVKNNREGKCCNVDVNRWFGLSNEWIEHY